MDSVGGGGTNETTNLPSEAGSYYLTEDVTLSSAWNVPDGTTNLCLNGHVIKRTGSGRVIEINYNNRTLNLYDCGTTEHKFTVNDDGLWSYAGMWGGSDAESATVKKVTGGVITGGTGRTVGSTWTIGGGGVYVYGKFNMYGGNIVGNKANSIHEGDDVTGDSYFGYGGGVYVDSYGTFTMSGGAIAGNVAKEAVMINEMVPDATPVTVGSAGGGVNNGGSFTMTGGKIEANYSFEGSGVNNSGTFTMTGGEITGNTANSTNYYGSAGGGVNNSGSFTMTGGEITGNTATKTCEDGTSAGGGVNNSGGFTMTGGEITGNTVTGANAAGGGVNNGGSFTMTGGEITGNTATKTYVDGTSAGGGVNNGGTGTLGGTAKITGNVTGGTITDGVLTGGTTNNLYLHNGNKVTIAGDTNAPANGMTVGVTTSTNPTIGSPVQFSTNGAAGDVQYFFSDSADYGVAFSGSSLSLAMPSSPSESSWSALQTAINNAPNGGIIKLNADVTASTDDTTLTVSGTKTLDLNGYVINANSVSTVDSVITVSTDGNLTITDSNQTAEHRFKDSDTTTGLWVFDDTLTGEDIKHTVTGGCITGGNAEYESGGVRVSGILNMNGGSIVGNFTDRGGGGVYVYGTESGTTFTMNGGSIAGNAAYGPGGGVYVRSYDDGSTAIFNMEGGSIVGNTATGVGSGVYVHCAAPGGTTEFNMNDGKICSNKTTSNGGGVYIYSGGGASPAAFNMNGGEICDNEAKSGGGVYNCVNFTMNGGMVTGNKATQSGGGVNESSGTFTMNGGSITGNTAKYGGGIQNNSSGKVYLTAEADKTITITGNTTTGAEGGIANWGTLHLSGKVIIKDNTCNATGFPVNFATNNATIIDGDLTGSAIFITHASRTDEHDAGVLTIGLETQNPDVELGDFFCYDGPDAYRMVLTEGELVVEEQAVSPAPSFDGGSSTSTITVPVNGNSNSVKVAAEISGTTATVKPITDKELATVSGGNVVEIELTALNRTIDKAKIPTESVKKIADRDGMSVKLTIATVTFDKTAAQEIASQAKGSTVDLVVDDVKEASLNAAQKKTISELDTALIIDAYLASNGTRLCSKSSGGFGSGKATVALPYEIKNGSVPANYSVYYVDDAGKLEKLNAVYDTSLKAFVFEIKHFSNYVVAYDENACPQDETCIYAKFTDADTKAWYHDGVHFCVENGYMQGVSADKFAPSGTLSRAMIVTMLWRMEDEPVVNYAMTFKDVAAGKWYTEAIRWAQSNKIVEGYDADSFGPENDVTREQLAAILYRYAQAKGEGFTGSWMFLLDFVDRTSISSWANEAVHWCSMNGVVNGKDGKVFDPQGKATRAEAAAMVQRFCEALEK